MRETTKRNIRRYSNTIIDTSVGLLFWTTVAVGVYAGYVYHNLYCNKQTIDT